MAIQRKELTAAQVAQLAGCSRQQIIRALETGKLRGRKIGREALIVDEDAKAFVASRRYHAH
jgi:excisionase family DNA binding protein